MSNFEKSDVSASNGDEVIHHIESARTKTLDRTVVLNVTKEYGWEVAVELLQSKSEGLSAYSEIIKRARQAASLKQQGKKKYSNEKQFFRGSEFYERDATSKSRRNFPAKSKWGNRTIKQSELEIHGTIWEDFIDFCNAHELVALLASRDSVLAYLVWSDIRGRTVKPTLVLTAISNQHSGQNLSDPTKSYEVKKLAKSLSKLAASDREATWPCDPLTVEALKNYVDNPPRVSDYNIWARDCALVAIGLRTMRRESELATLSLNDFREENGLLWIRINRSKTDQQGVGKFIPIELTN
ncbi:44464_t:CDS:2 [Gigaspora margarita]|uniref:44464_t:CDS:1 n=1 Tax=Gigaspora margarita TaxID=4874 RepID=A0ABN7UKA6_GIGMA|nr:44464_t:CDS:2 [Gigaspora margarita]